MSAGQTPEFKQAVKESHRLKSKPTDAELLEVHLPLISPPPPPPPPKKTRLLSDILPNFQIYSLFRQGTQDPPFDESKAPGMFNLKVRICCG